MRCGEHNRYYYRIYNIRHLCASPNLIYVRDLITLRSENIFIHNWFHEEKIVPYNSNEF